MKKKIKKRWSFEKQERFQELVNLFCIFNQRMYSCCIVCIVSVSHTFIHTYNPTNSQTTHTTIITLHNSS